MNNKHIDDIILNALKEDSYNGDVTSQAIFGDKDNSQGRLIAKEAGVIAGLPIFSRVFELLDPEIQVICEVEEGAYIGDGQLIARIQGPTIPILVGERVALNLLQRLSGIATMTNDFVQKISETSCRIVDTRKTTPGLRVMEKYAVRIGGGHNHRFNLSDGVMIKDNHIKSAGGIKEALEKVKAHVAHTHRIEIEIESLEDLEEAIVHGADIVMLDNMSLKDMKKAVELNCNRVLLEASGNVSLQTVQSIAETGVHIISCGKLTHSVSALDISLKF